MKTTFLISSFSCDIRQRRLVVGYRRFGATYRSLFRDQAVPNPWRYCLTLENTAWPLEILLALWRYCLTLEYTAWSLKIPLDPRKYCLTLEYTAWSLKIPLDPWKYCLILEDTAWPLKILLDPWKYCLTLEDTAWPLEILLDLWRYRLTLEYTAWPLEILLDPWRYRLTLEGTAWPLKMGPIGYTQTSVTTNLRCVTPQKGEDLAHTAAETWNHARIDLIWQVELCERRAVINHSPNGVSSQLKKPETSHNIMNNFCACFSQQARKYVFFLQVQALPDLGSSYTAEGQAQVEICASRNWIRTCACTKESSRNP